ncbi:MAG TPA: hypothetical protein DDZ68_08325 [Parvularcula sp.]|nr:hypothetical protein [Parvularcula sp.]HBS32896.1 hypothetical protein [Parvularcula sp.]
MRKFLTGAAIAVIAMSGAANAQAYPDKLLWGDTHLHTNLSVDAYFLQNRTADADTAYRFAKGKPVIHPYSRARMQLQTPLDFLAVSDHAELMGTPYALFTQGDKRLANTRLGKRLIALQQAGNDEDAFGLFILAITLANTPEDRRPKKVGPGTALLWRWQDLTSAPDLRARATRWLLSDPTLLDDLENEEMFRSFWAKNLDAATKHNQPGKFTTFAAWEYSPTPDGANLHRIVVTDGDPSKAKAYLPYSANDSGNPEDLWRWLAKTSAETGADFVSIPHNSNISKGRMFANVDYDGRPLTADYARLRANWEPVAEVTQIKGTSETHPILSPDDEFAGFEFFGRLIEAREDAEHDPTVTTADYVRSALKTGLELEAALGVNPFKLGMIGATDSHSGLSSAEENNFTGKFGFDVIPENKKPGAVVSQLSGWDMSASGLAGVWAKENTREEIFAAFKRREVYATTGPRMAVRFFGGFEFSDADLSAPDLAAVGYSKGVPMGADIAGFGAAPSFLIQAVKDPKGANLDRVQVVKGWLGADGKAREKVYDAAWSAGRERGADGKLAAVGETVDVPSAHYTNAIGAAELTTVWRDPDFNASQKAFYYVRALEIPTPRNSTYDAAALGEAPPEGHAPVIQERAFTSPIWYSPGR